MKKIIKIIIEYPDCDVLNIDDDKLKDIAWDACDELAILEDIHEGRYKIKIGQINENKND